MRRVDLLVEARRHAGSPQRTELPAEASPAAPGLFASPSRGPARAGKSAKHRRVIEAPHVQPRDLRLIDPLFAASQDPAIEPRRGCIIVNLPPTRAIVTRDRCYFIPSDGVDEELRTLADRVRRSAEAAEHAERAAEAAALEAHAGHKAPDMMHAAALPWELHVLEALLLTVTTRLRRELGELAPRAKAAASAMAGGGRRAEVQGCLTALACRRQAARRGGRPGPPCSACCGDEDGDGGRPRQGTSRGELGVGMIGAMGGVRRSLGRLQERGRAMGRCLESVLESPTAMARLDLTAAAEAMAARERWAATLTARSAPRRHAKRSSIGHAAAAHAAAHADTAHDTFVDEHGAKWVRHGPAEEGPAEEGEHAAGATAAAPQAVAATPPGHGTAGRHATAGDPAPTTPALRQGHARRKLVDDGFAHSDEAEEEEAGAEEDEEGGVFFGDAVELLLESYLGEVEAAMSDARRLETDAETAERQLSLMLASSRNALLRTDLTISVIGVVLAMLSVVGGFFGMNVPNGLEAAGTGTGGPFFVVIVASSAAAALIAIVALLFLQRFLRVTTD